MRARVASVNDANHELDLVLEVRDLEKHYAARSSRVRGGPGVLEAVDGVSFTLARSQTLCIVGESGAGKSTLARTLLYLDRPDAGSVHFRSARGGARAELGALSERELRRVRPSMQIVFQDPYASLNPRITAGGAIREVLEVHRAEPTPASLDARVAQLFTEVGLGAELRGRFPHELSGGQRQRVAIARALASDPELLVLDEPVSALDISLSAQVLNLLLDLQERRGLSYVYITHDLSVVPVLADRVAVMHAGRFVEQGSAVDVLEDPQHAHTRSLLRAAALLRGAEGAGSLLA